MYLCYLYSALTWKEIARPTFYPALDHTTDWCSNVDQLTTTCGRTNYQTQSLWFLTKLRTSWFRNNGYLSWPHKHQHGESLTLIRSSKTPSRGPGIVTVRRTATMAPVPATRWVANVSSILVPVLKSHRARPIYPSFRSRGVVRERGSPPPGYRRQ